MNVKTLCLGSLCLMDGTGYGIKKLFEEAFRHLNFARYGSNYPPLNRLEQEGKLDCIETNQDKLLAEHATVPDGWPECMP